MATIDKIKRTCPYEIRLNMFLIQTEELNNRLVDLCEDLIDMNVEACSVYVFNDESDSVTAQVRQIQAQFGVAPKTTQDLVMADNYFKEVEGVERQKIQHKYESLVDWLMFLQMLPQPKCKETKEEDVKRLVNAY
jgi:hypothetical protein